MVRYATEMERPSLLCREWIRRHDPIAGILGFRLWNSRQAEEQRWYDGCGLGKVRRKYFGGGHQTCRFTTLLLVESSLCCMCVSNCACCVRHHTILKSHFKPNFSHSSQTANSILMATCHAMGFGIFQSGRMKFVLHRQPSGKRRPWDTSNRSRAQFLRTRALQKTPLASLGRAQG